MIGTVHQKQHAAALAEVLDLMRKRGLALSDLIQVGGEGLKSSNPKRAEKARRVTQCWELMARLSVRFADVAQAPGNLPTKPARKRRGEGHFSEVVENKAVSDARPLQMKPNEINNLANSVSVGGLGPNSDKATGVS